MANNPVTSSQLFKDDGAIDEAIKNMMELRKTYVDGLNEVVKEAKEVITALKGINTATSEGRGPAKAAATDAERLAAAQKKYVLVLSETDAEIARLKKAQQESNRMASLTEKLNNSAAGSYNKLSAQYSINKIRLNAMGDAERKTTASGKALETETRKMYEEMDRLQRATGKATLGVGWYERAQMSLKGTVMSLTGAYIGLAGAQRAGAEIYDKTKELNSTDNSLKAVITDQGELGDTYKMLSKLADDYGVDVLRLSKTYVGFKAAAKETNIPLSQQIGIFQSIVKSGAVLGRTTEETEGALLAITQMMSKGSVQSEELRGQLGERLPGAFTIMAKSMGVSVEVLGDMLKKGEVFAKDVLPEFARQLEISFGADQISRIESLAASEGRLENAQTDLVKSFDASGGLTTFNNSLAAAFKFIGENIGAIGFFVKALGIAAVSYAAYTLATLASNAATALWAETTVGATVITRLKEVATWAATRAELAFSKALKANPAGIILAVIVAAATAYLAFADNATTATKAQENINSAMGEAAKATAKEKTELNNLLMVAKNEKLSKEQRLQAIKRLNAISPEYLSNLTLETINTREAAAAIDDYIKSLNKKAITQALESKQVALASELADKELKSLEDYKSSFEKGSQSVYDSIWKAFGVDVSTAVIRNSQELDKYILSLKGLSDQSRLAIKEAYLPLLKAKEADIKVTKDQQKVLDDYYKKQIEAGKIGDTSVGSDGKTSRTIEVIDEEIKAEKAKISMLTDSTKGQGKLIDQRIKDLERERDAIYKAPEKEKKARAKKVKDPDYWQEQDEVLSTNEEGMDKDLEALRINIDKKLVLWKRLGLDTSVITEFYEREQQKIRDRYADEALQAEKEQTEAQKSAAQAEYDKLIDLEDQKLNLRDSEIDILKATEEQKTKLRIKAEIDRLKAILKINEQYGQMLTDTEIKTIQNTIKALEKEADKPGKKDLYDMLGLVATSEQKQAVNDALTYALDNLKSFLDSRVQIADQAVQASQKETEASKSRYDAEIEARNNGYANSVITAQKDLEQKKKNEAAALKEKQKALKAQNLLDTATQVSSLTTASTNIWKSLSAIPFIGPGLAVAAIATMFGSFAAAKIKAKQASKDTYGEGGFEFLHGGSHASGNDIPIGTSPSGRQRTAEGGETLAIIKKSSTNKYRKIIPDIINSLNKGTFENRFANEFPTTPEMASYVLNAPSPDLSKIQNDLTAIRKRGERKTYTDSNGNEVIEYKNVKRIIKG